MTLQELAKRLDGEIVVEKDCGEITEFYSGDFLSRVIGKAPRGCAWFTIMNSINVAGVAELADIKAIVICENILPVTPLLDKCADNDIAVIVTPHDAYKACVKTVI